MVEFPMKTDRWGVVRRDGDRASPYFFTTRALSNNVVKRVWLRLDNLLFDRSTDRASRFPHGISILIWVTISALLWLGLIWVGLQLV
jgi:hypothetical protein